MIQIPNEFLGIKMLSESTQNQQNVKIRAVKA